MKIGNKKIIIGAILIVVLAVGITIFSWLKSNTSLLTTSIPTDELNLNNLNTDKSEAFKLYETSIEGKTLNLPQGL
jgi:hypothetical protein